MNTLQGIRSFIRQIHFLRVFIGHILPATGLFDFIFKNWKVNDAWRQRINICISCPDNEKIPRCKDAGNIKNGKQLMHNGIWINVGSYYGPEKTTLFYENKGVHEPQEEYLFQLVLDFIADKDSSKKVMIELGSFWAFYSLWFKHNFPFAKVIMVEPERFNIESGKRNFKLNRAEGHFVNAFVSDKHKQYNTNEVRTVTVDGIIDEFKLENIDILHSDIQGFERDMLAGAEDTLKNQLAEFLFISTHSNEIHLDCLETIKKHSYRVICDINLDDSFSDDGLIVACNNTSSFKFKEKISKRSQLAL